MDTLLVLIESELIATIISAIVTWFSSDRWVAKNQLKREHSLKLKDSSIIIWINKIDSMCPTSVEYDHNYGKIYGTDSQSYEYLQYSDFIESHMTSGYSELHAQWMEYKLLTESCADIRASILDDLREEFEKISQEIEVPYHYHKQGISRPTFYIQPFEIAEAIMREKLNRFECFEDWYIGKPSTQNHQVGEKIYPRLYYHNNDLALTEINNINAIREKMYEILDDREYHSRFVELHMAERDVALKKKVFVGRLYQLVEYIELGNNLKGRCRACDKSLHKKFVKSERELIEFERVLKKANL